MKRTLLTLLAALTLLPALADEGMWLPSLISTRIDDMRAKGFRLTAEEIYSINRASMKDAVVLFDGGCTGELISAEGLLLTNHHCGYDAIQAHSSVEHDYLTYGFWARTRAEELPNEKLNVKFLVRMEEITDRLAGRTDVLRQPAVPVRLRAVRRRAPRGGAALVDRQVRRRHRQLDLAAPHGRLLPLPHLRLEGEQAGGLLARQRPLPTEKALHDLDERGARG